MQQYKWKQGILLTSPNSPFVKSTPWLAKQLKKLNIITPAPILIGQGQSSEAATANEIKRTGIRIIIALLHEKDVHEIAKSVRGAGMSKAGWCWIFLWIVSLRWYPTSTTV